MSEFCSERDPATEAAKRAVEGRVSPFVGSGRYALRGAREALAPLRKLHRPTHDRIGLLICAHCSSPPRGIMWPCATAKLVYSSEELGEVEGGV